MAFFSFAGTKFHIGGPKAFQQEDFDATDFASGITWIEVKDIESIGAYGDQANFATFSTLGTRRIYSFVTGFENSPTELVMARNADDPGQAALVAAAANPNITYSAKITYDDAPPSGTPTVDSFIARFAPPKHAGGNNESVVKWTAQVIISSNIVTVPRDS